MTKPLILAAALAAFVAGPAALLAQTTETPAADSADAAETQPAEGTGSPNLANQLDTGEAVGGAPEGQDRTYIKERNGDWALQCLAVSESGERADTDPCQMYQLLTDGQGSSVAEVSIFKLEDGGQVVAGGTFVVPLETLLTQKLTIQVDSGQARRYDFSFCTPVGCYARVGFAQEDINRFKAGAVANVTIVPVVAPDQRVTVPMSLSGFTATFDKVTPVRQGN